MYSIVGGGWCRGGLDGIPALTGKNKNIPSRRITPIQEKKKNVGHFNDVKLMEVTVPSNS